MSAKTPFEVTEKAGTFVAGVRNPGTGKRLELTEEQARYPLIAGEIRRPASSAGIDAAGVKPKKA